MPRTLRSIDTAADDECRKTPYCDYLIARLIACSPTREDTIGRMKRALEMMVIEGIKTRIPLQ